MKSVLKKKAIDDLPQRHKMRRNIVHPGADELIYEIRQIVGVGKQLEKLGVPITWEK